jgi:Spy/CpxP family protein refolding chaperone
MTLRTTLIIAGVVLVVAAGGAACDRGRLHGRHLKHGHAFAHAEHALDEVDATDEQRARVRTILSKALTDLEPWPPSMERLRADLATAWRSDTPDREGLHRRVEHEIESLRALSHALVDDGLALHGVLTSDQRRRLLRVERSR